MASDIFRPCKYASELPARPGHGNNISNPACPAPPGLCKHDIHVVCHSDGGVPMHIGTTTEESLESCTFPRMTENDV